MKKRVLFFLLPFSLLSLDFAFALTPAPNAQQSIYGKVADINTQSPLEYANIILYDVNGTEQITGTVTDKTGYFELSNVRPGTYMIRIKFIGFEAYVIEQVRIKPAEGETDLGTILLTPAVIQTGGVQIEAEKQAIEFQIDKKVVNVAKHYTAASGTAVDVLENVPSVNVDAEGNVELRGSSNFQVLIDNRPTILDPNDALQQIPAGTIETIEVITNPSAKYDPDGTAGILNIITKKKDLSGISGIFNGSIGSFGQHNLDGVLSYKTGKYTAMMGFDYNERSFPGNSIAENITTVNDTAYYTQSEGSRDGSFNHYSVRGGLDYYLSDHDIATLGFRYGGRDMNFNSAQDYEEWSQPGDYYLKSISRGKTNRGGDFLSVNLDYTHQFTTKGHELKGQAIYQDRDGDEDATDEQFDGLEQILSGTQTKENGPSSSWRLKLDYTLPFDADSKLEAGYQSRLSESQDYSETRFYSLESDQYVLDPFYTHTVDYRNNIHAFYSLYAGKKGNFGYQTGLRTEYTDRNIKDIGQADPVEIQRWDFFPTLHVSHGDPNGQQFMASYTRRIERPRGWNFEPYLTWVDAYTVRQGNPDLLPEYIDSYELGYQTQFGKNLISLESYYRITNNRIEQVRSVYDTNVMLHTVANVGKDYALGAELMLNLVPIRLWTANLIGNLYRYRVEGIFNGESFDRDDLTWHMRMNNTFRLAEGTRLQVNGMYFGPTVSAQGKREGSWGVNLALRQDLIKNRLNATLQVQDVFQSFNREQRYSGSGFSSYSKDERKSPSFSLTMTWNFNNYKSERRSNTEDTSTEFETEGMEF